VKYEWDEDKAQSNWRKHGVTFEVALDVFEDERCVLELERVDEFGEERWKAIGSVSEEASVIAILVVVHVYREKNDGEEIIRIISARKADSSERRIYQEQEMD
jgi:uncharacterized protein